MREILFRGKLIGNGQWMEGYYIKHDSVKVCFSSDDPETKHLIVSDGFCDWGFEPPMQAFEVLPETVGQYTGLKDRNGKRIFEGDIVRYYSTYREELTGENCVVEYGVYNCSCCDGVYGWEFKGGDIRIDECYEIIGNIHDNPELMKGEHDPRNCEYFIPEKFGGWGGCIGTKEIDPCEGAKCKRWKQKEG